MRSQSKMMMRSLSTADGQSTYTGSKALTFDSTSMYKNVLYEGNLTASPA
jgi:hypothetical protein